MTVEARIDAGLLADALAPVDAIVHECKLHFDDGGVTTQAVDPANVAMASLEIPADCFESYHVGDDVTLGVNLERLLDVVGMAGSDDTVALALDPDTRKLELETGGLEYTLALIDPDTIRQEPELPDLELPGEFVFAAAELDRAVRAADLCSDHIAIRATEGEKAVRFEADGDTDDVSVAVADDRLMAGSAEGPVASLFSLDYLQDIKGALGDSPVTLRVGEEVPLRMRYYLGEGGDVTVENMIAPRIEGGQ
jgi:proliferating cell nuclear antigen